MRCIRSGVHFVSRSTQSFFLSARAPYVEAGILWRESMSKLIGKALGIATVVLSSLTTTVAWAGGNGNGGSGGGGAHGAATSGMTYHSEPVSSPWNRPPWPTSENEKKAGTDNRLASMHQQPDAAKASN
jgi:hypothetical protein